MAERKLDLTVPEAALMLTIIVSLADDDPSEEEAVVLRKFYRRKTALSLEEKLTQSGVKYPENIMELEPEILNVLGSTKRAFIMRTLAVCLKVAEADGVVDQNEMNLLNKYCDHFKMTMFEVETFGRMKLKELSEVLGYGSLEDLSDFEIPIEIELSPPEAGLALTTWVAFSDDNPTDEEMAVVREFFGEKDAADLIGKMKEINLNFPAEIPRLKSSISDALGKMRRDDQLKTLAIAYRTAGADGSVDPEEQNILDGFCEEFTIGLGELRRFF